QPNNHNSVLSSFTNEFGVLLNSLSQNNFESVIAAASVEDGVKRMPKEIRALLAFEIAKAERQEIIHKAHDLTTKTGETRVHVTKMTEETYALSYESQRREESKNYGHLDDLHAEAPSDYSIGKPLFIKPCSREAVAEVFRDIGRQAGLVRFGGSREWLVIVCDGLPFVLGIQVIHHTFICTICDERLFGTDSLHRHEHSSNCSLEFDWVWLQPGPGHIEMNMLRSFVKMMWEPFWGEVVEIFNFKSENAKRAARNKLMKNTTKTADCGKVNWLKMKWICYIKEDLDAIYVKEDLNDGEFKRVPVSLAKRRSKADALTAPTPVLNRTPQSINKAKYQDLMSIVNDIPEDRRRFYQDMRQDPEESNSEESED
ncbi:hypothetical protein CAPTEDRAFT_213059, partial [Capitella teleta]